MPKSSKIIFIIISIAWFLLSSNQKNWSRDQVKSDVVSYYSYLPAVFIDGDITLGFLNVPNAQWKGRYWAATTPNGKHIIKTTMGASVMYLPFFLIAHYVVAPLGGYVRNGYTEAYQACLAFGSFIYLLLGLLFLRKTLLLFYTEKIAMTVIISIYFGTNLLWYSYGEALMAHEYIFCLVSLMIYFTIKWYEAPTVKYSIFLALACGMIILVRPGDLLLCLFPLLYGQLNKDYLRQKLTILKQQWPKIVLIVSIVLIIQLPQLVYWKVITGQWLYNSYTGENFYWNHPHIIEGLFGYRKGWLLYTPMMAFTVIGFFFIKNKAKNFTPFFLIIIPLFLYILFCWWSWWYGGSFGMRPLIDMYPIFAIPMGASFAFLMSKSFTKMITISLIIFFIALNMLQTYQYNNFILHYDSMTRESYWQIFGKVEKPDHWWEKLHFPDAVRSVKGLPETYTKEELFSGTYILRTEKNKLIATDTTNIIEIENYDWNVSEHFKFILSKENKIILLAPNKKYVTITPENKLLANTASAENATGFDLTLINDNKIQLTYGNYKKMFRVYMSQ